MTETYVCPECTSAIERSYNVKYIIHTCGECGTHGRFINDDLLDRLYEIPEEDQPDDWPEMSLEERMEHAIKEDLIDYGDLVV